MTQNLHYVQEIEQRGRTLLATHHPTDAELEHASALIQYFFNDVVGDTSAINEANREFYTWAHEKNIRYVLQWLLQQEH